MTVHSYVPRPPLSDLVVALWAYEGPVRAHQKERLLPSGTLQLIVNLQEDLVRVYDPVDTDRVRTHSGSVVCGPYSRAFVIDTAEQTAVMGVHFKPGGAFPFLGAPADELHDSHVSLDDLWADAAGELRDRLLEARGLKARFAVLEQALWRRLRQPVGRHPAVSFALAEFATVPPTRTIADVTARVGLSPRRFIEVFRQQVGLTPKVYCRIRRFQAAVRRVHRLVRVDWADLALACGYFDQAHFIRDFQSFAGINPSAYLAQRGDYFNHVPVPERGQIHTIPAAASPTMMGDVREANHGKQGQARP